MGVYTKRAIDAKEEYDKLVQQISDDQKEEPAVLYLLDVVNALTVQFDDILTKMQAALEALGEIKGLFLEQARSYQDAITQMGLAKGTIDRNLFLRKLFISKAIDKSVMQWQNVSTQIRSEFTIYR